MLPNDITEQVRLALNEDIGTGDVTAALLAKDQSATAKVICRQHALLCGTAWFDEVFHQLNNSIKIVWRKQDGDMLFDNDVVCHLTGPIHNLLTGERTALNFLQTLSGVATKAKRYANAVQGTKTVVLDTRKTLPGLRLAEKYAVQCGGCSNHRIGLYDEVLIKENHIHACGSIKQALAAAKKKYPDNMPIEIEVESIDELQQALGGGAKRILLDNFSLGEITEAVAIAGNKAKLEVSGNVTLDNIAELVATGIDYISIGDLSKNLQAVDFSMCTVSN